MKKHLLIALTAAAPAFAMAQTAVNAMSVSQTSLKGTARYMSMGGAFTALGGDISTLNQNPAGIGVYRSSDVSLTFDLDAMSVRSQAQGLSDKNTLTKFNVNSFGYVGAINTGSETMPYFNWGVSYARTANLDRRYGGRLGSLGTSYTNLVADYTNADGFTQGDLLLDYNASGAPWSSMLMFDGFGINPSQPGSNSYKGLYDYSCTAGDGYYDVDERGHIDEYSINMGGNVMDVLYWGIGIGITDLDFKQSAWYGESFYDCNVPSATYNPLKADYEYGTYVPDPTAQQPNTGDYGLSNYHHIWGSGFNFKAGVIVKPVNELRIGLAVHTPTYYNLSYEGTATMAYGYNSPLYGDKEKEMFGNGEVSTPWSDFDWKLRSPWRLMAGVAGVIGGRFILSADYEYRAYGDMTVKDWDGNPERDVNGDIKTYCQSTNIVRLGAEYRLTPSWSVRAGYSHEGSPVKTRVLDTPQGQDATYVYTSGPYDDQTNPSYTLERATDYVTCGLGYKYRHFYADLAYVHRRRSADYHAFTDYNENNTPSYYVSAPTAKLTDNSSQVVLTMGVRF